MKFHDVKSENETLAEIAKANGLSVAQLREWNSRLEGRPRHSVLNEAGEPVRGVFGDPRIYPGDRVCVDPTPDPVVPAVDVARELADLKSRLAAVEAARAPS